MGKRIRRIVVICFYVMFIIFILSAMALIWEIGTTGNRYSGSPHTIDSVTDEMLKLPSNVFAAIFGLIAWAILLPVKLLISELGISDRVMERVGYPKFK